MMHSTAVSHLNTQFHLFQDRMTHLAQGKPLSLKLSLHFIDLNLNYKY